MPVRCRTVPFAAHPRVSACPTLRVQTSPVVAAYTDKGHTLITGYSGLSGWQYVWLQECCEARDKARIRTKSSTASGRGASSR